ncbi:MAG: hypothetical protein K0Q87_1238 [Neobacillus sp.]|jgi:hypothetical protein|nr:hypothetical protein [Neobacillus sp.]
MKQSATPKILKLDKNSYVYIPTGEIREFTSTAESRADNLHIVAQSLKRLRDLINTNVTEPLSTRWATLTYKENMTDEKRLYEDYKRFWQRFKYYLEKKKWPACEYIACAEPQGRGAWHLHVILIFENKAPFIPNNELADIWGHGFTKITDLSNVTNVGLYLTAYLADMELSEAITAGTLNDGRLTAVKGKDENKAIIKGARLRLYPANMRIYRTSRGIKQPVVTECTESEAQAVIGNAPLVYEKTISLSDETGAVLNVINYRQYNSFMLNEWDRTGNERKRNTD